MIGSRPAPPNLLSILPIATCQARDQVAKHPDRERPPMETGTAQAARRTCFPDGRSCERPYATEPPACKGPTAAKLYRQERPDNRGLRRRGNSEIFLASEHLNPRAEFFPQASKGAAAPNTCACLKPDSYGTSRRRAALTRLLSCRRSVALSGRIRMVSPNWSSSNSSVVTIHNGWREDG